MARQMRFWLLIGTILGSVSIHAGEKVLRFVNSESDVDWGLWGLLREESFGGKNFNFLNNNNPEDRVFYFRHTWDTNARVGYGLEKYGCRVAEFKASMRQRTIWGFAGSTARTADADVKVASVVTGNHAHDLPRLFIWMREGWLKVDLNSALGLSFSNKHSLTVGAFAFELGRGIALGAAYAVGPTPLGFYADSVIDQFAFGVKLSGDLIDKSLRYDFYGSILQARSYGLGATGAKILGQQFGHLNSPMRGFGKDSYLIAARLMWTVFNNDHGLLLFEPYVLYNNDPEQKIQFLADASSKLGTWGLASEYEGCRGGFGFDMAFNMGRQHVKGWDRNQVQFLNSNGDVTEVNSQVLQGSSTGPKVPFSPGSADQQIIFNADLDGEQDQSQNGQPIIPNSDLYNSPTRYRNSYNNTYHGMMAVADAAYWIYKKEVQLATTVGYASGDRDPNFEVRDSNYGGFVGLQEVYRGKRVLNVFLLGTVGRVRRPGSTPEEDNAPKDFATSVGGFNNILFWGGGFTWQPSLVCRTFNINPNVFVYWEPAPGNAFDPRTKKDLPFSARKFLGTEFNMFISAQLFQNLKLWGIGSAFFPDGHFTDIRGKPLDREQLAALNRLNRTGFHDDKVPNIGDNTGFTLNFGVDYTF